MSDLTLRSARRQADRSSDPLDLARVLVERLRAADPCGECFAAGEALSPNARRLLAKAKWPGMPSAQAVAQAEAMQNVTGTGQPCPSCAGFGSVLKARVALAAYCGSEAARIALFGSFNPPVYEVPPALIEVACAPFDSVDLTPDSVGRLPSPLPRQFDLAKWLSDLSRWQSHPFVAPVRAALAAAEAVCSVEWVRPLFGNAGTSQLLAVRRALDAVVAWLADPSEDRRLEACRAWLSARPVDGGLSGLWIPCPTSRAEGGWGLERPWTPGAVDVAEWNARAPSEAARLHPSGEPAIREAIQRALVAWALG